MKFKSEIKKKKISKPNKEISLFDPYLKNQKIWSFKKPLVVGKWGYRRDDSEIDGHKEPIWKEGIWFF